MQRLSAASAVSADPRGKREDHDADLCAQLCHRILSRRHASAANPQSVAGLDQLIPREKWDEAGLNKLTVPEQQRLAGDITLLLATAQTAENSTAGTKDRSQWRKLQRHMTKDDVRKLLGEPKAISVSKFAESWYYADGNVTYDGKGRLDMWSEL